MNLIPWTLFPFSLLLSTGAHYSGNALRFSFVQTNKEHRDIFRQNERVGLIGERLAVAKRPKLAIKHLQTCGGHLGGQSVKAGSQKTEPRRVPVAVLGRGGSGHDQRCPRDIR